MSASALLNGVLALLISQLGDPHYICREKAHAALTVLAPIADVHLEAATRHADAEIAHRARRLWEPFREQRCAKVAAGLRAKMPWLHLPCSYELYYLVDTAEKKHGALPGGPEWENYRVATRLWLTRELVYGRPLKDLQVALDVMAEQEREWVMRYQTPPP